MKKLLSVQVMFIFLFCLLVSADLPARALSASPCPSAIGCASGECRAGLALAGVGEGITGQATQRKGIRIKDAMGRSVEVGLPVKRMVVLTSDALEVIRALNAENFVVGANTGIARGSLTTIRFHKDSQEVRSSSWDL